MNGIGTLLFILITKGKAPAYLGSSFAFIAPSLVVMGKFGYEYALGGFVVVGLCGCILSLIIYKFGSDWIDVVLPPAAMGPVVALIGLELSGTAAKNAGLLDEKIQTESVIVFLVTLGVVKFGSEKKAASATGVKSTIPQRIAATYPAKIAIKIGITDKNFRKRLNQKSGTAPLYVCG